MQASRQISIVLIFLAGLGLGIQPAKSQFASDFQTNIISGVANNWPGDYHVGSNTLANVLLIQNGGALTNGNGYLGYLATSSSNTAVVADVGSVWHNYDLDVGASGRGNTLLIRNAGRVVVSQSAVVGASGTSSGNQVVVADTNSVWSCNSLNVGFAGSGNQVIISNGGWLIDSYSQVGSLATCNNNAVSVTGVGSVWSNASSFVVGLGSSYNRVTLTQGGRLVSSSVTVADRVESSGNSIVVSDNGSLWDNSAIASVINFGRKGTGNRLVVTNGGNVLFYYVYFGRDSSSHGNSALVSGSGSRVAGNCYIYVGNHGHNNSFTAADGATVDDKFCYINYEADSSKNSVLVTGTNTSWQNSWSMFVGVAGTDGTLTISNGATMNIGGAWGTTHNAVIGYESTSRNNRALVTGSGSRLNSEDDVYVGFYASSNSLIVGHGGRVASTDGYLGTNPGSDKNRALVTGTGSLWTNRSDFYVGYLGAGNSLVISNGGRISDSDGFLGRGPGSDTNRVLVTGSGSLWTNSSDLYVGCFGSGNSLVISNGGWVGNDWGRIGYDTNSWNNQVQVVGSGSVWSNSTAMVVGDSGSSNSLIIRDGGLVYAYSGVIGNKDSSSNNTVYVESGGVWRNDRIYVGNYGLHNALFVNGGSVFANNLFVGYDPLYCNNLVQLNEGEITVTNATSTACLEVYGGSLVILGGTLRVDTLRVADSCGQIVHLGGTLIYKNLELDPNDDADVDGMPNGWEQANGLNPLNPTDAGDDKDGDQVSNWDECMAGTSPTNSASYLHILSQVLTNHDVRITWSAVGGKRYFVQTNSAAGNGFSDCSPLLEASGTGETTISYLDVGAATNFLHLYYRIRLAP